jgi:L-alanine-DL-glutamate epimerase-like enolase superfamily enzyme
VRADVARVGGVTPRLKVTHTAEAFNVKVAPHFLRELHANLARAVPAGTYVEHTPQLSAITRSGLTTEDGCVVPPEAPGLGIDGDEDAIENLTIS